LPDGNIHFLGRTDHQVKIRGFRIELEEIEVTLRLHPAVRQSLVTVVEDQPDQKRLVAYVIPGQEPLPPLEDLHDFLKEKLPASMIPSAFVPLERFPLTVSGKIDRQALSSARLEPLKLAQNYVAPANPLEQALAEFWQQLLHVDKVGACDNFFYLGGHSILVVQLISKIRQRFQVDLPLRTLFEQPTIRGLAGVIEALKNDPVEQSTPIKRANREVYRSKVALR
jgi:acyl carrier protein